MTRVLLFLCLMCPAFAAEPTVDRLYAAIVQAEGASHGEVGKHGERWESQMLPSTAAAYPGTPEQKAKAFLRDIIIQLKARGVYVCTWNVALCYTAGIDGALSGRYHWKKGDYATRVKNIEEHSP